jgi:sugar lactone lactonase YvrE
MAGSTRSGVADRRGETTQTRRPRFLFGLALLGLLLAIITSSALADDEGQSTLSGPSTQEIEASLAGEGPAPEAIEPTDPEAAETLPHIDLDRDEAAELLSSVFAPELEGTAGIFDELEVERFHGDHVALIAPGDQLGQEIHSEGESQPTLLESTLPLRTENESGEDAAVDLTLEATEEGLQPANPLVEVGIPAQLGEGISLPETGVEISLAGAPAGRAPSIVEGSTAFYPNVTPQGDGDLSVAPAPLGVETSTQLRSADAPDSQTFDLGLPEGASLRETEGGAEVVSQDGEPLVVVPAPSALDAAGEPVPVRLETSGHSVIITTTPDEDATLPILVDPLWEKFTYGQAGGPRPDYSGWTAETNNPALFQTAENDWCAACNNIVWGLELNSFPGSTTPWSRALWDYHVPRWAADAAIGKEPTTYINYAMFGRLGYDVGWEQNSHSISYDPIFEYYLWDNNSGFVAIGKRLGTEGNLSDPAYQYLLKNPNNNENAKQAELELVTTQPYSQWRHAYVGDAWLELTENDRPEFTESADPDGWVNNAPNGKIPFKAFDPGLGVYEIRAWELTSGGSLHNVGTLQGCTGGAGHPCPRNWSSTTGGPALNYDPSIMPQGENRVSLDASDVLGHLASQGGAKQPIVMIKVDHTAPGLAISGTLTEQGKLGTTLPEYTLKYTATDGFAATPAAQTPFGSLGTGNGQLKSPRGIVADKKGHVWVVDRENNRVEEFNESGEYIGKIGSTGSGNGQFVRPNDIAISAAGNLWVTDGGNARIEEFNSKGEYLQQFGTGYHGQGEGGTIFLEPLGVATAPNGMVWVSDYPGDRVAEYRENPATEAERFVRNLHGSGSNSQGEPEFAGPMGLAVDPQGNVFVAEAANHRIEKFSSSGQFQMQFGSLGSAEGQLKAPSNVTIAPSGNLLVADTENNRISEFLPNGNFIRKFGSLGAGSNQLSEPRGVAVGAGNVLFVADKGNNRVARWSNADLDPQSGVAKVQIKVDGEVVKPENAPGCATRDCELSGEWPLKASQYSDGAHTVEVTATDGVGLSSATQKVPIVLNPDRTSPSLFLSGSMTEQASLGTTRPRYALNLKASDFATSAGFSSSFGTAGTGNGQLSHPADAAVDSKGNLWVIDKGNNRLEKFNEKGEYLAKYGTAGTGNGQLSAPSAVAIDSEGSLWVADTGNNRLEKFNEKGEYVSQFGTKGSGNGQFSEPSGIAVAPNGWIYIVDRGNRRVQLFSKSGAYLGQAGSSGSGHLQLSEPSGIAIGAPSGESPFTLLIADSGNNRVLRWTSVGAYLSEFGSPGTGPGQFNRPEGISVDSKGNVWVGDQNNGRIEAFNEKGEYVTQFGTKGSGAQQFSLSYPLGIESDVKGNLWITDTNNNRIQKWSVSEATTSGVASTTIKLDGKVVDSSAPGCPAGGCSISREWILNSSSSTPGQHTAEVTAIDASGVSATKSLTFSIAKDTTAPQITANASLYTAPEGWVEQQSYPYTASASDANGYGNTSLMLKIDGKVVKAASQTCPDGACEETLSGSIDIAAYAGGAHPAELIATDGAGNLKTKKWTVNVDPEGHISVEEAEETLEAVEATSPTNPIGEPKEEEEYEGTAPGLGIEEVGGHLKATGDEVPTTIGVKSSEALTMEIPNEQESVEGGTGLTPIEVVPVKTAVGATSNKLVRKVATVAANTTEHVDTITRPLYDGAMNFDAIRDASAPETFTWQVHLAGEQELRLIDEKHAEVDYAGTERTAFSITAAPARDAIGRSVPTSLSVSGTDEVTLRVFHHASLPTGSSVIYPVVAGVGWQGGFQTYISELPPPEPFPGTLYFEGDNLTVGAPEASISSTGEMRKQFVRVRCGIYASYATGTGRPSDYTNCGNPFKGDYGEGVLWNAAIRGVFFYRLGQEVKHNGAIACDKWINPSGSIDYDWALTEASECRYGPKTSDGNGGASASPSHYLRAQAHWSLGHRAWCGDNCGGNPNPWIWEDKALELHLWPSGSIERLYQ